MVVNYAVSPVFVRRFSNVLSVYFFLCVKMVMVSSYLYLFCRFYCVFTIQNDWGILVTIQNDWEIWVSL